MISYDEARVMALRDRKPRWRHGTFCLDDREIVETDDYYVFKIGAREFLVDGDRRFEVIGATTVVYQDDGRVMGLSSAEVATSATIRTRPNPSPTLDAGPESYRAR